MITIEIVGQHEVAENITIAQILAKGLNISPLLTMERADRLLAGETLTVEVSGVTEARALCQALNDHRMQARIVTEAQN